MKKILPVLTILGFYAFFGNYALAADAEFDTNFNEPTMSEPSSDYEGLWLDFSGGVAAGTDGLAAGMDGDGNPIGQSSLFGRSTSIISGSVNDDSCGDCAANNSTFSVSAEAIQDSINIIENADGVAANATRSNSAIMGTIDFTRYREQSTGNNGN